MPFVVGRCSARHARSSSWGTTKAPRKSLRSLACGMFQISPETLLGTPLVSDLFKQAQQLSVSNLFCYVNSDIIFMSDFMQAIQRVVDQKSRFLLVGHRWNLDVKEGLEFTSDWEEKLRSQVKKFAILAGVTSIDFF